MINVRAYSHKAKAKKIKEQAVVFGLKLQYDIFDRNIRIIKIDKR